MTHYWKRFPRGVMVKAMDCGIVEREFVLQSHYYVQFRANTLGKGMNPLILSAMGWIVQLLFFFGIKKSTKVDVPLNKETKPNQTNHYWKLFTESLFTCLVIGCFSANHGPLSAHLPYPHTCVRAFFKLTSPFPFFYTNDVTRNIDCWRNWPRVHVALPPRKVIPWETQCKWGPRILRKAYESVRTSQQNYMQPKELLPRRML